MRNFKEREREREGLRWRGNEISFSPPTDFQKKKKKKKILTKKVVKNECRNHFSIRKLLSLFVRTGLGTELQICCTIVVRNSEVQHIAS